MDPDRVPLTLQIETDGNDGSLTQNEMLVLQVISKKNSLSAAKISSQVCFSKPSVERVLRSLKEKGQILREGATRGKWIILQ
ncbi:MAG: MarR family transcriptional regulator [Lachnospiraceae bacterium]|nr:MarR family transcriptional regulator [Lachnospiraceae bacterium]